MFALDTSLLITLAHPCIGASIGYLTNKVAIRMLFRPLEPWFVFGLQLPMTPGVIPSKRHVLAENIGEMVGRHLLTSRDIGAAISEEPFQEHLANLIERRIREIMLRDLGPIGEEIPRKFKAYFKVGVKTLKYRLSDGVNNYLAGAEFEEQLRASINNRFDTLAELEINAILAPENRRGLYLFLDEIIRDLLQGEQVGVWLGDALAQGLRTSAAQGTTLADLVPQAMVPLIKAFVREHSTQILEGMGRQVADPLIRAQVISGVLGGVDHFLDSLGPMGAMARGFLEKNTLEQKIGEYLGEKEADLVAWFSSPEIQVRMQAVMDKAIDDLLARPVAELLAKVTDEDLTRLSREGAGHLLGLLQEEGALNGISALVHVGMEDLIDGGQLSFAALGQKFFADEQGGELREVFIREVVTLLRSHKTERLVNSMLTSMVDGLLNRPIGLLYNLVPHGVRRALNTALTLMVNRMLLQEVPGVVESLNLKRLVTEKVDSLDLLQLERLLLSIMEEQFKYINLFGAFLGFLLGLINLVLVEFL
ncbi:MAG: DUF445 family protein [Desulfobulbus sp.]|nr:DUF445 family protein [Desulfobulbus sp.]